MVNNSNFIFYLYTLFCHNILIYISRFFREIIWNWFHKRKKGYFFLLQNGKDHCVCPKASPLVWSWQCLFHYKLRFTPLQGKLVYQFNMRRQVICLPFFQLCKIREIKFFFFNFVKFICKSFLAFPIICQILKYFFKSFHQA